MKVSINQLISRNSIVFLSAVLFGLTSGQALAADLDLADIPLEVKEGVPANIVLTMDDSGSMAWAYLPDDRNADRNTDRFRSSTFNKIYYNPEVTYVPGVDKNGTPLPDSTFTAAWHNGYSTVTGVVNLTSEYDVYSRDYRPTNSSTTFNNENTNAYYYTFDSSNTAADATSCDINNTAHVENDDDCYDRVDITAVNAPFPNTTGRSDCATPTSCTYDEEKQNFANWYSYYRVRHLLAKTATSRAFAGLSNTIRVSWQELNDLTTIGNTLPFGGTHRSDFYDWLFSAPTAGGTPLTNAVRRAGEKFRQDSVYRADPADNASVMHSCRQNFHFTISDGYWNSNSVSLSPGNYDNQTGFDLPTTGLSVYGDINYNAQTSQVADRPSPIYRDGNSNFLADIAFYYWANDLNGLDNNVPHFIADKNTDIDGDGDVDDYDIFWNPKNDPAEWQHMVNFNVSLGIVGELDFDGTTTSGTTYTDLLDGTISWPTSGSDASHVDDLWHAAINSRGGYFTASSPERLVDAFDKVLNAIDERKGSSSSVATTSSQYQAGTLLFQAIYDPSDWSGDVLAKDVVTLNQVWSADAQVQAQVTAGTRQILTFDPTSGATGAGIPFLWADLNATQQTQIRTLNTVTDSVAVGQQRLDYLRGDKANELQNGGNFRNRGNALGDVVHSDPNFIPPPGAPLFFYPNGLETTAYSTYVTTHANRPNMLIYGANDGMVHVHNADTGYELFSYVPNKVVENLSNLTDPGYTHQYYVDQAVSFWDVYYTGAWHTVAVGGLGKGGQGLYALDLSNPASFGEANAGNIVMWEFTDADDADLGYTYTKPQMMKMNNDEWMVAFSNGYNSTEADGNASSTGDAILFLLDVEHGGKGGTGLKVKLSTENGTAEDPLGQSRANRLTNIVAVDKNNDFKVDFIWAGDLFGNLWKFDVSSPNPANWDVIKQGTTPKPLFIATDDNGVRQPITIGPAVQYHQAKNGFMLFFGTGKYVENNDPADLGLQTFYAVWDREETNLTTITRDYLLEQQMLGQNLTQFAPESFARITTDNPLNWYSGNGLPSGNPLTQFLGWRINLADIDINGDPIKTGERLDGDVYVFANRVEFQTLIPDEDPCVGGGTSWIFALNATTGSRFLTNTPWDYNADGRFDTVDKVDWGGAQEWGSGISIPRSGGGGGLFRRTRLLDPNECQEVSVLNHSDGSISTVRGSCSSKEVGRRSWREVPIQ